MHWKSKYEKKEVIHNCFKSVLSFFLIDLLERTQFSITHGVNISKYHYVEVDPLSELALMSNNILNCIEPLKETKYRT